MSLPQEWRSATHPPWPKPRQKAFTAVGTRSSLKFYPQTSQPRAEQELIKYTFKRFCKISELNMYTGLLRVGRHVGDCKASLEAAGPYATLKLALWNAFRILATALPSGLFRQHVEVQYCAESMAWLAQATSHIMLGDTDVCTKFSVAPYP